MDRSGGRSQVGRADLVARCQSTGAGILMTGMVLTWVSAPAALFVASVGAISVFKAVYIDKRALKCACVGGNSNVPLGFVSLTENLMMIGMAAVMLWQMV